MMATAVILGVFLIPVTLVADGSFLIAVGASAMQFPQHLSYATSMEILAGSVLGLGTIVFLAGPEAKGIQFHKDSSKTTNVLE